jgi:hypothetical protein
MTNRRIVAVAFLLCGACAVTPASLAQDSEYLIFVVDTSGSMKRYEWDRVQQQLAATLDAHPAVAGIQVLNDEGNHLFRASAGEWLPATPAQRQLILDELEDWDAFSNSSPRRGILSAIDTYADPAKSISLFVMSDDFSSGASAIGPLVREIDAANRTDAGALRLRINGIGFPVYFDVTGMMGTGGDYAALMRTVAQHNGGSFTGLPRRRSAPNGAVAGPGPAGSAQRTLFLVDASAGMAGANWRQAIGDIDTLTAALGSGSSYQVVVFNQQAATAVASDDRGWLSADDQTGRSALVRTLGAREPAGEVSLAAAVAAINAMVPSPDAIELLVDGLPTLGAAGGAAAASEGERMQFLLNAGAALQSAAPINVRLYAADDEPIAASAYWSLALASGGQLLAPAGVTP